jgi:hypothetical protein
MTGNIGTKSIIDNMYKIHLFYTHAHYYNEVHIPTIKSYNFFGGCAFFNKIIL